MAARFVLAFALVIGLLTLFSAWSYRQARDDRRSAGLDDVLQVAYTTAALMAGLLSDIDRSTLAMASAMGVQPALLDQATAGPYLAAMQAQYPFVRAFYLMNPEGITIATPSGQNLGLDLSAQPYARALRSGQDEVLTDVMPGPQTGTPLVVLARTVRGGDGAIRALLAVAFYPDQLRDVFPGTLPSDTNLSIYDRRGWLVYSSANPTLPFEQRDTSGFDRVQQALAGAAVQAPRVVSPVDGQERLAAFVPIPAYGWAAGASRTVVAVEAPLQRFYQRQLAALGLVTGIALLLALLFSRTLTRPLVRLAGAAQAVGRGEPLPALPGDGPAEVRSLTGALSQMASDIARRSAEREQFLAQTEAARAEAEAAERRLAALVENAADIILTLDQNGRVRYASPAVRRVLGIDPDAHADAPVFDFIHPDDATRVQGIFAATLMTPGAHDWIEFRVRHADRSWRVVEAASNVRFDDPAIGGVVVNIRDITDRKRAEDGLRASRDQLGFLAEASRLLVSSLDYETTLTNVARLAVPTIADWCSVHLSGEDGEVRRIVVAHRDPAKVAWAEELQRRYLPDPAAERGIARVLRTGKAELYTDVTDRLLVAVAQDEEHLAVLRAAGMRSLMLVPLVAHGHTLGLITLVAAESERRYETEHLRLAEDLAGRCALAIEHARLYQAERQARQEAEAANQAKDEFLAVLSHELRTPLTPILGFTSLLRRRTTVDAATLTDALDVIERSATTQVRLVNDLLDVSRIITGKLELEWDEARVQPLVRTAVEGVRPAAQAKGITLVADLREDVGAVLADVDRLEQVVTNLLTNAIKFTPAGGHVSVQLQREANEAVLTVRDTGIGIPPGFLPHVFDRFRQADSSSTRTYGGLGLGLAIVRSLVEQHGGRVAVASDGEGAGATFTVWLPLIGASRGDATPISGALDRPREPPPLAGKRILVVEDDDDTRAMLQFVLEEMGAEVRVARSSREGRAVLERWYANALVVDIGMPEEDGYTFLAWVRSRRGESGPPPPAVALTAYASAEDRRRALAAGFDRHLAKPLQSEMLLTALRDLLAGAG